MIIERKMAMNVSSGAFFFSYFRHFPKWQKTIIAEWKYA